MRFSRGTRLAACLLALSISLPGGLARAAESAESPLTLTEGQSVTLTLEAPQTGEYRLELEFMALTGKTVNPQATLSLGEAYRTSVTLPRLWKDLRQGDRFAVDEKGNELVPRQEELFERQTVVLSLVGGGQPVKLEAGRYTLTLTMTAKSIELYGARLCPPSAAAMPPIPRSRPISRRGRRFPSIWKRSCRPASPPRALRPPSTTAPPISAPAPPIARCSA